MFDILSSKQKRHLHFSNPLLSPVFSKSLISAILFQFSHFLYKAPNSPLYVMQVYSQQYF